jgi:hypothetical protein
LATPVRAVSTSDVSVGDPTKASHYNDLRTDALTAFTEYDYGDTADLPGSPALGQSFMDKEADVLYACFDAGSWTGVACDAFTVSTTGLVHTGTGPYSYGIASLDYVQSRQAGTFTSGGASTLAIGRWMHTTVVGVDGDTTGIYGEYVSPTITTQDNSETVSEIATAFFKEPAITKGTDTVTTAATVLIKDAPTEGTNNYALLVEAGSFRLGGAGPHAYGTTLSTNTQHDFGGSFTGSGTSSIYGVRGGMDITAATGHTGIQALLAFGRNQGASINTQGQTETIGIVTTAYFDEPDITKNTGDTITTATTVYVRRAPSEGAANYSIYVEDGTSFHAKDFIIGNTFAIQGRTGAGTDYDMIQMNAADRCQLGVGSAVKNVILGLCGVAHSDFSPSAQLEVNANAAGVTGFRVNSAASPSASVGEFQYNGSDALRFLAGGVRSACMVSLAYDNGTGAGTYITLERNSNVTTPATGFIKVKTSDGVMTRIWPDASDDWRTWTGGDPTNANDGSGTVIGTQTSWHELKKQIQPWKGRGALDMICDTPLYSFRFKDCGQRKEKLMHGIVIFPEDRGSWYSMNDQHPNAIPTLDQTHIIGYLIAAIKEMKVELDVLKGVN